MDEDFDFVDVVYKRLSPRFEEGLSHKEFYRLCGILYSLKKAESRQLLHTLERRFPEITVLR